MNQHTSTTRRTFLAGFGFAIAAVPTFSSINRVLAATQEDASTLTIVSPEEGATVTSDDIALEVAVANFTLDGQLAGRPDEDGIGHLHVMIDGMTMAQLTNFYATTSITVSGVGLEPGPHTVTVTLASNTHMDMMESAQQVTFDFQPANPRPLPDAQDLGVPGVTLLSPADGDVVPAVLPIRLEAINFNPSADLEGKPNVPGFGHYHVFVDTPMSMMDMGMDDMAGTPEAMADTMASPEAADDMMDDGMAMMSMTGMVAMPGSDTFDLDLTAWGPGMHTIWIEPVQNDHTMFAEFDHVEFVVTVEG